MERFKAVDAGIIAQKENDPSFTKDENDRITQAEIPDSNAKMNFVHAQQVGAQKSQQPLKARNMATQPQNQTHLLEKFRKLRQWQQQQQESMFRQQQQAMETLKKEQSKLQTILAAQKKLQEQQNISSLAVQSPNLKMRTAPMIVQSQPQQFLRMPAATMTRPEVENDSRQIARPKTTVLPTVSIPISLPLPVSNSGLTAVNQVEFSSRTSKVQLGVADLQQQGQIPRNQFPASEEERLEGSLASLNATVYPMMWNSSNYRLPFGAIPSSSVQVMPLQGQPFVGLTSPSGPMSPLGMNSNEMTSTSQSNRSPNSTQELKQLRKYNDDAEVENQLDARVKENEALQKNNNPITMTKEVEKLWRHNPGAQALLASVESHADDQSEADAMSGVYPLCDSESEMCLNEVDDEGIEDFVDAEFDNEDDCEESFEKDRTVIDMAAIPAESNAVKEQLQEESKTEVADELRPIKPGIGGGSSMKTFEELLEQQLKLEEASKAVTTSHNAKQKPQRTFLRKGEGLARFKGKSTSNKTVGKQSTTVPQKREKMAGNVVTQGKIMRKVASKSPRVLPDKIELPVPVKQQPSQGSKGRNTQVSSTAAKAVTTAVANKPKSTASSVVFTRAGESNPSGLLNSIDASFQMRLQELEEKQGLEEEELEEFELLEQAAANASFSSNSSVVVKVLAKARGNVQDGKHGRGPGGILSPVDTGYGSGDGKVSSSIDHPGVTPMNRLQENVNEDEDEDGDITLQEMSLDSALELDENDEDIREKARDHQQNKGLLCTDPTSASLEIEGDFNDEEAWGEIKKPAGANAAEQRKNENTDDISDDDDYDSDVTISDIFPLVTSTPPARSKRGRTQRTEQAAANAADEFMASTPPTSALVTKLFPQLKPKQKPAVDKKQAVSEVAQTKARDEKKEEGSEAIQSIAVRQKLKELEAEIDKFRTENAALAEMRTEREEGLEKLRTEITAFEKQKSEELERLEQFREEELRKLRRERRVFEKYQKAARTMPDKKERDEIEALRTQVAELQEELKRRESRWSAASTRSRQRIESLEQQNKELQDEVKLLEHYRLQQWREEEQEKAMEEEESRPKKPLQRKTVKTTEEEAGPRLPPSHRSPPLRPSLVEIVPRSTPENLAVGSANRSPAADLDANNNYQTAGVRRDKNTPSESLSKSREEDLETAPVNTPENNPIHDVQQSKRSSSRQRSKTPDSNEKMKRNVHFQDEKAITKSGPGDGTGRPDQREIMHSDGKVEKVNSDGSRVISFANGTRKDISADGQTIIVTFFNGDVKQMMPDQRVIYYYSDAQTTHTTYPDGLEVLQFPSKQIEKHYRDGTKEIIFPDQTIKYLYPNGAEECVFSDGTIQKVSVEGERTIEFPNGQRETHTKYYKKREYPDGTVKTVYPDGRTETRYATGRVRVKDRDGRVLVDSSNQMR